VDQGDGEALRQSMCELMLDRDLRDRLASAGQSVPAKFPWENTVDQLETIYQSALDR
jgi:glycosyltransferase involved in cell wall biosynthesis